MNNLNGIIYKIKQVAEDITRASWNYAFDGWELNIFVDFKELTDIKIARIKQVMKLIQSEEKFQFNLGFSIIEEYGEVIITLHFKDVQYPFMAVGGGI